MLNRILFKQDVCAKTTQITCENKWCTSFFVNPLPLVPLLYLFYVENGTYLRSAQYFLCELLYHWGTVIAVHMKMIYLWSKCPTPLGLFMMLLSRLVGSLKNTFTVQKLPWRHMLLKHLSALCKFFKKTDGQSFKPFQCFWPETTNSYVIFPLSIFQKCAASSKRIHKLYILVYGCSNFVH